MQAKISFRAIVMLLIVLPLCMAIQSCGKAEKKPQQLRIWAILPLTGPGSSAGGQAKNSITAVLQNLAGSEVSPVRPTIEFVDSKSSPKDAVSAFQQKLAAEGPPDALIVQMSAVAAALAPMAKEIERPLFSIGSTEAPVAGNPYFFVTYIAAAQQAALYNEFLGAPKNLTILHQNDEYGRSVAEKLRELRREGGDHFISFETTSSARDLATKVEDRSQPVVIVGFGAILGDLVRELRTGGFSKQIVLSAESVLPPNPDTILPQKTEVYTIRFRPLPSGIQDSLSQQLKRPIGGIDIFTFSALALIIETHAGAPEKTAQASHFLSSINDPSVIARVPSIISIRDQRLLFAADVVPYADALK